MKAEYKVIICAIVFGLTLWLLTMCGCNSIKAEQKIVDPNNTIKTSFNASYDTPRFFTLESCEYAFIGWGNDRVGVHKGNCKACRHYLDSLILSIKNK